MLRYFSSKFRSAHRKKRLLCAACRPPVLEARTFFRRIDEKIMWGSNYAAKAKKQKKQNGSVFQPQAQFFRCLSGHPFDNLFANFSVASSFSWNFIKLETFVPLPEDERSTIIEIASTCKVFHVCTYFFYRLSPCSHLGTLTPQLVHPIGHPAPT